jgi:nucleotide-binding universal stress UspA family protein
MKRILLATDGSTPAQAAAQYFAHLPHEGKVELTVLSVIEPPSVSFSYRVADWIKEAAEYEKTIFGEAFQRIEQTFEGANVTLKHVVLEGVRGEKIVQFAKEQASELIVLGARGHSRVDRLLLGSTSDFVATHAHCSVFVVRPSEEKSDDQLRIAIGFEETSAAHAAVDEFSEFGWGKQTEVDLVSVISFDDRFVNEMIVNPNDAKKAANEAVQKASVRLHETTPQAEAHLVECSHVGEGLVLFAENHHCDLLVVGETPRNFLGRLFLSSVSHYVLRHAPCSVWIARNL